MESFGLEIFFKVVRGAAFGALTCFLVIGGGIVGTIPGAIKAGTTETGVFHGAGIGIIVGAMTSCQLLESLSHGDSLSKKMEVGERARSLLNCGHFYHMDCIDVWLSRKGSCPICRQRVC